MEKYNTLDYYNENAEEYCTQTKEGDFLENYNRFLSRIDKKAYILDFGCGSGRDSKYFLENGYKVRAIDGSIKMCEIASRYINQEVEYMDFSDLDDLDTYDAIWACASILHVEKEKLPSILSKMLRALKPNGIIYTSFKKGEGYMIKEGKYYNFLTKEELEKVLEEVLDDAKIVDCFETLPTTKRQDGSEWINFIIQKIHR